MFGTYLRRELVNRRKQTIIIAVGMALAIALVIVVNAVSAGVKQAQASVLESVYGVGTDITVTEPATAQAATAQQGAGGGPRFDFGADAGTDTGAGRTVDTSRLEPTRGASVMDATALGKAQRRHERLCGRLGALTDQHVASAERCRTSSSSAINDKAARPTDPQRCPLRLPPAARTARAAARSPSTASP